MQSRHFYIFNWPSIQSASFRQEATEPKKVGLLSAGSNYITAHDDTDDDDCEDESTMKITANLTENKATQNGALIRVGEQSRHPSSQSTET